MFTFINLYHIENKEEFLFYKKGTRGNPLGMTYVSIDAPWHKKQKYDWFKVSFSKVFKIFEYFLFQRIWTTPIGDHTRNNMVIGLHLKNISYLKVFRLSRFRGGGGQKYPQSRPVHHLIAEGTRTYMVYWLKYQWFSKFKKVCHLQFQGVRMTPGVMFNVSCHLQNAGRISMVKG